MQRRRLLDLPRQAGRGRGRHGRQLRARGLRRSRADSSCAARAIRSPTRSSSTSIRARERCADAAASQTVASLNQSQESTPCPIRYSSATAPLLDQRAEGDRRARLLVGVSRVAQSEGVAAKAPPTPARRRSMRWPNKPFSDQPARNRAGPSAANARRTGSRSASPIRASISTSLCGDRRRGESVAQAGPEAWVGVCLETPRASTSVASRSPHAIMHTTGQAFVMSFQAGGPHAQGPRDSRRSRTPGTRCGAFLPTPTGRSRRARTSR